VKAEAPAERRRDIHSIQEPERLPKLRTRFEKLDPAERDFHPLLIAFDKLQTLDTVRIILGTGGHKGGVSR
jgi:hypothetical protein